MEPRARDRVDEQTVVLVKYAYGAFNRRDIDGALRALTDDVEWANGWEGGYEQGHRALRAYWIRQWAVMDRFLAVRAITTDEQGRVIVQVDQQIRRDDGSIFRAGEVRHVLTMRDGLVARMDIEEPEP